MENYRSLLQRVLRMDASPDLEAYRSGLEQSANPALSLESLETLADSLKIVNQWEALRLKPFYELSINEVCARTVPEKKRKLVREYLAENIPSEDIVPQLSSGQRARLIKNYADEMNRLKSLKPREELTLAKHLLTIQLIKMYKLPQVAILSYKPS